MDFYLIFLNMDRMDVTSLIQIGYCNMFTMVKKTVQWEREGDTFCPSLCSPYKNMGFVTPVRCARCNRWSSGWRRLWRTRRNASRSASEGSSEWRMWRSSRRASTGTCTSRWSKTGTSRRRGIIISRSRTRCGIIWWVAGSEHSSSTMRPTRRWVRGKKSHKKSFGNLPLTKLLMINLTDYLSFCQS